MRRRSLLTGLLAAPLAGRTASAQPAPAVDALLALAVDVSLSISEPKFELERRGYAQALTDPRVLRAIREGPLRRIAVALYEWAGPHEQTLTLDWTPVADAADARALAERLLAATRPFYGRTALGAAIDFGARLIAAAPFRSERRIIDVSGDGTGNAGRPAPEARDAAVAQGITINGIVILTDPAELPAFLKDHTNPPGGLAGYYRDTVIGGEVPS